MNTHSEPAQFNFTNRQLGAWGEDRATEYLEAEGYQIGARNWRCREGELDIIAYAPERRALVAVEVKTRRIGGQVAACEAISARKLARLRRLLILWINETNHHCDNLAIDLIAITLGGDGTFELEHRESLA